MTAPQSTLAQQTRDQQYERSDHAGCACVFLVGEKPGRGEQSKHPVRAARHLSSFRDGKRQGTAALSSLEQQACDQQSAHSGQTGCASVSSAWVKPGRESEGIKKHVRAAQRPKCDGITEGMISARTTASGMIVGHESLSGQTQRSGCKPGRDEKSKGPVRAARCTSSGFPDEKGLGITPTPSLAQQARGRQEESSAGIRCASICFALKDSGRGAPFLHPVQAARHLSSFRDGKRQGTATPSTLAQQTRARQSAHSGQTGCASVYSARSEPGRSKRSKHPVRAARKLVDNTCATPFKLAQFPAPVSSVKQRCEESQTRCAGTGSAGRRQIAHERQSLHAFLAAVLTAFCLAVPAQAQTSSDPQIDRVERQLLAASGRPITLRLAGVEETGIFHAPLGVIWLLDSAVSGDTASDERAPSRSEPFKERQRGSEGTLNQAGNRLKDNTAVTGTLHLTRTADHLYLNRDGLTLLAGPDLLVQTHASDDTPHHPLALFHNRLLSRPLAEPLGDLPAGSRFQPDGTVTLNTAPTGALWRSLGDHIEITPRDGQPAIWPWTRVDAALTGDPG